MEEEEEEEEEEDDDDDDDDDEHPILKHSQPTFLPQCQRPSFTPIQNNRQNYSSVYLNSRQYTAVKRSEFITHCKQITGTWDLGNVPG
jgi:hypothetical protein